MCHVAASCEQGPLLLAGMHILVRGAALLASTRSNFGGALFTLTQQLLLQGKSLPEFVDLDRALTNADVEHGRYFCNPMWGSRRNAWGERAVARDGGFCGNLSVLEEQEKRLLNIMRYVVGRRGGPRQRALRRNMLSIRARPTP